MPLVCEFFGIKIYMYWVDHFPEHFHAHYGEFQALISIREAIVLKGALPGKQIKLVLAWCEIHQDELLANWLSAQKNGKILKIEPLR